MGNQQLEDLPDESLIERWQRHLRKDLDPPLSEGEAGQLAQQIGERMFTHLKGIAGVGSGRGYSEVSELSHPSQERFSNAIALAWRGLVGFRNQGQSETPFFYWLRTIWSRSRDRTYHGPPGATASTVYLYHSDGEASPDGDAALPEWAERIEEPRADFRPEPALDRRQQRALAGEALQDLWDLVDQALPHQWRGQLDDFRSYLRFRWFRKAPCGSTSRSSIWTRRTTTATLWGPGSRRRSSGPTKG